MKLVPGSGVTKEGCGWAFAGFTDAHGPAKESLVKKTAQSCINTAFLTILAVLVCLLIGVSNQAWAQYQASITGRVTDPSGAVVPAAKVLATNLDNGFAYPTTSNSTGFFTITSVPPGNYKVTVTTKGFQTFEQSGISLAVSQHATVNAQLKVGSTTQTVTVTGAPPRCSSPRILRPAKT
jgi:Carboxypeptidase regulatory-like domain